jgi:hypothetical protein
LILTMFLSFSLLFFPCAVTAGEYEPDELEYAPEVPVDCSWSKLSAAEYKNCQLKKAFFEKMSAEERKNYNARVKSRRLERRIERIERVIPGVPVGN